MRWRDCRPDREAVTGASRCRRLLGSVARNTARAIRPRNRQPDGVTLFGERWANAWRRQYLRHFRSQLRAVLPGEDKAVVRSVTEHARQTYEARRHEAPDPQGLMIISSCSLILESYRELVDRGVSQERAFEVVRGSFSSIFAASAGHAVRGVLRLVPDPVATIRRRPIAPLFREVFGSLFSFEDHSTDRGTVLTISRCGIYDFFLREGEPGLTRAFCAWDRNWLGELDHSPRPVATRRSLTLVTDGKPCEFHFDRAQPLPAPTVDVTL
jgi:hypothetical protein